MQKSVTFRHMESSEALKKYAEDKSDRLSKYLFEPIEIHWVLSVERIRHIADATVNANGTTFKSQFDTQDMYSAIDMVIDKIEGQAMKHKEKLKTHKPHNGEPASIRYTVPEGEAAAGAVERPRIVKKENQFVKPMSVEEASMQMDIIGKDFLVFTDSATGNISVIYRLKDGDYGLIETTR
ncbi:MAG TPA: ribosome-associated translation inhibitor RaiA [Deltaproteobacteria bacterium]|nr:MAG: ribosomal subunit interface protein [Deltaproteobacteria bacterium GWA2_55_82]OGQ62216.1 MAG: ribosomal subunit interface protein [Deltaproteobacteria bacterium RIFCSPLOWO2_02_FULL_55_12]OIJ73257.1 MAG: ribosomal subunit interface protein [Deltaproteobacteria bacterium GWC2_55_46]HBG45479.1 ribosome-associated translation inhibitor RaiA [Deltaproteobacteria bacterium]HCY10310.1 ribosome-associated translation inhibitor RaiA [Deltaproteobacteria bacterium]